MAARNTCTSYRFQGDARETENFANISKEGMGMFLENQLHFELWLTSPLSGELEQEQENLQEQMQYRSCQENRPS